MPNLTKTERAYLAGLWDGEGSITLWKHIRKESGKPRLIASLVFTNTNLEMIDFVQSKLEDSGATFHRHKSSFKGRSKDCYQLTSRNRESVERTIKILMPYLIAKKEQAQIVLAFVRSRKEQMKKTKGRPSNTTKYTSKEFEMEQNIRGLINLVRKNPQRLNVRLSKER